MKHLTKGLRMRRSETSEINEESNLLEQLRTILRRESAVDRKHEQDYLDYFSALFRAEKAGKLSSDFNTWIN